MVENGNGKRVTLAQRVAQRALVLVEPYVYADRTDEQGEVVRPRGLHAVGVRINQALVEAGKTPPWVLTPEQCRAFWASREVGGEDNDPYEYAHKDPAIVDFLHTFWQPEVSVDSSVLELGCNAGGNLSRLHALGYTRIAGIDINPRALDTLRSEHPDLAREAELTLGPFEDVLPTFGDRAVDCVFTMAVGIHIHPASHVVFREMVRIAARNVCVLESEIANGRYTFARNYRRVFERLGCVQVKEERIDRFSHPEVSRIFDGYVARLFRVGAR